MAAAIVGWYHIYIIFPTKNKSSSFLCFSFCWFFPISVYLWIYTTRLLQKLFWLHPDNVYLFIRISNGFYMEISLIFCNDKKYALFQFELLRYTLSFYCIEEPRLGCLEVDPLYITLTLLMQWFSRDVAFLSTFFGQL